MIVLEVYPRVVNMMLAALIKAIAMCAAGGRWGRTRCSSPDKCSKHGSYCRPRTAEHQPQV